MRDSMIIYRSFFEAISGLEKPDQADVWNAVFEYGLNQTEVELSGVARTVFILIKPQLDANLKRYNNGSKPKQKQTISEPEAKPKQTVSKTEANVNDNVNDNHNANENASPATVVATPSVSALKKFVAPSLGQVIVFFQQISPGGRGPSWIETEANKFVDYYTSKGWKVSNAPMRDWEAAGRNWIRRANEPINNNHGQNQARTTGRVEPIPGAEFGQL